MADSRQYRPLQALLALLLCLSLTACMTLPFGSGMAPASIPAVEEARKAWTAGNMARAEKLYGALIRTAGITQAEKREAWSRHATAAARNGRPGEGLKSLQAWLKAEPGARAEAAWQDAWFTCAQASPPARATALAKAIWQDATMPELLRLHAAFILTGRSFTTQQILQAAPRMSAMYAHAPSSRRPALEQRLLAEARCTSSAVLSGVIKAIPAGKDATFPYSVLILEQARRLARSQPDQSAALLARVRGAFADKSLPDKALKRAQEGVCVVLALPGSGSVSAIGRRVGAGAALAQQELEQKGTQVQLETIDTEQPDWLSQLASLPPQCVVVGGPLRAGNFQKMKSAGTLSRHAVFAFMPQLNAGEEGNLAWRFFPSPQDQVDAVLRLAADDLGLRSLASVYPEEGYGRRMNELFTQAAQQRGARVLSAGYAPSAGANPEEAAGRLLQDSNGELPEAIFLPDSWKKMDRLVKGLLPCLSGRTVLLGTALWEQSLSTSSAPQAKNMELAVFPAAWNPRSVPTSLAAGGRADFWKLLGYDFVRFAAAMNMDDRPDAAGITARARNAQQQAWTMAPISWDGQGVAHQAMQLFTPAAGMTPLNIDSFRLLRQNRPDMTQEDGASPAAQDGQQQPLSTTPRSTHKLQLPGAR
ncbi:MAG: hypothetical protein PUB01_06615 [Desulfovibrionaceae bacterium]|nr:hypothetical protein [Desulfovibrionaceae bacterium]